MLQTSKLLFTQQYYPDMDKWKDKIHTSSKLCLTSSKILMFSVEFVNNLCNTGRICLLISIDGSISYFINKGLSITF